MFAGGKGDSATGIQEEKRTSPLPGALAFEQLDLSQQLKRSHGSDLNLVIDQENPQLRVKLLQVVLAFVSKRKKPC